MIIGKYFPLSILMTRLEDYMTVAEAAKKRKITRQAVWLLVKRGRIRAVQVGATWLVNKGDIENYDPHPGGRPKKTRKKAPNWV
jgi:excisionase family DNA binding protein